MIFDNEHEVLELLSRVLQQYCTADVRASHTFSQAISLLEKWKPEIVVSGIATPDPEQPDGDFILNVRDFDRKRGTRTPVVALASGLSVDDRLSVLKAGYETFVPKPVDPREFLATLASLPLT